MWGGRAVFLMVMTSSIKLRTKTFTVGVSWNLHETPYLKINPTQIILMQGVSILQSSWNCSILTFWHARIEMIQIVTSFPSVCRSCNDTSLISWARTHNSLLFGQVFSGIQKNERFVWKKNVHSCTCTVFRWYSYSKHVCSMLKWFSQS